MYVPNYSVNIYKTALLRLYSSFTAVTSELCVIPVVLSVGKIDHQTLAFLKATRTACADSKTAVKYWCAGAHKIDCNGKNEEIVNKIKEVM